MMRGFAKYRSSGVTLIMANLLPLIGIWFWGWDIFPLLCLYWAETVIIGGITILKIITWSPDRETLAKGRSPFRGSKTQEQVLQDLRNLAIVNHGIKILIVPFFALFFGFTCFLHGICLFGLFGEIVFDGKELNWRLVRDRLLQVDMLLEISALALSHSFSFFVNYLGRNEFRRTFMFPLMIEPYRRFVILHLLITLSAFATATLGSPAIVLVMVVVGKTYLDLQFHFRERWRNERDTVEDNVGVEPVCQNSN